MSITFLKFSVTEEDGDRATMHRHYRATIARESPWPAAGRQNAMKVAQVAQLLQSHDRKGVVFSEDVQKLRYRSLAVTAQYGAAVTSTG